MRIRRFLSRLLVSEYSLTVFLACFTAFCLYLLCSMCLRAGYGWLLTSLICIAMLPLFIGNGISLFLTITGGFLWPLCIGRHCLRRGRRLRPSIRDTKPRIAILVFSHEEESPLRNLR